MAMKISEMMVDEKAQEDGEWVDVRDGLRIKVRSAECKQFTSMHEKEMRPYNNILRNGGTIPKETAADIYRKCLAETVLLDWDGIVDDDGKPIKYSMEKAKKFLKEAIDFADAVTRASHDRAHFRIKAKEAATKN